jgi:hypothetical protein
LEKQNIGTGSKAIPQFPTSKYYKILNFDRVISEDPYIQNSGFGSGFRRPINYRSKGSGSKTLIKTIIENLSLLVRICFTTRPFFKNIFLLVSGCRYPLKYR